MATSKKVPVIVTTKHKGVFFGYGIPSDAETIKITSARMCIYWGVSTKGVMGLAATGPDKSCRIGPSVPSLTLRDVTAVMEATPEAEKAWGVGFWG